MTKQKIKVDLSSYLSLETGPSFRVYADKALNIIHSMYESKKSLSEMTGWLDLPYDDKMFHSIKEFTGKVMAEAKYEHLLVIGIGGSSLGAQALIEGINTPLWNRLSRGRRKGFLTVDFIDNLDPVVIRTILSRLKLDRTLILVISKGGSTVETIVPMLILREWIGEGFYKQCVFITTQGKGLLFELATRHSVPVFPIPENVGGRYSVFSAVGLLPASLCGLNLDEIKSGIVDGNEYSRQSDFRFNAALAVALLAYSSYIAGRSIFVIMPYSSCLRKFADWFVQLWSESLGKEQKGSTPLPAVGATDQHSQLQMFNEGLNDKLICFIKINKHKRDLTINDFSAEREEFSLYSGKKAGQVLNIELDATRKSLTENRRSNLLITLPELDEYYLSQLMYFFEVGTAVVGKLIGVNPFNQPGVELAKKYTKEALKIS